MKTIVTGCAGFIGMHVAQRLLERGEDIIGVDNINNYYDQSLKNRRLSELTKYPNFKFAKFNLDNRTETADFFSKHHADNVVHLAAQAGVRHSVNFPEQYIDSNLTAFGNILEGCRALKVKHFVYASSSSVYGGSNKIPFKESECPNSPHSLYAATKIANELMSHSYSHLYKIPSSGLRFFTVYGPWGRQDMAPFLFTNSILNDRPIKVFNNGLMYRDFTYIDDIVDGVIGVLDKPPIYIPEDSNSASPQSLRAPSNIFNIGNNTTVPLLKFIELLEDQWGKKAIKEFHPMQPGDIESTCASIDLIHEHIGYSPAVPIEQGVARFVSWYKNFYQIL